MLSVPSPSYLAPVLVLLLCDFSRAGFNYTKCPHPLEIQSETVKKTFNLTKFEGHYYELALHDYTQYPVCPSPRCMTSRKVVDQQLNQINDTGYLQCVGHSFPVALHFKLTDVPGHFNGSWKYIPGVLFPDTVVDVFENSDGVYEWVIEFQCVEKFNHVWFIGINWYSRVNSTDSEYIKSMLDAARERGLGIYMDSGEKVFYVDQTNCS